MRRALAILKYLPAVLCGLLVVAWVVSAFSAMVLFVNHHSGITELRLDGGTLSLDRHADPRIRSYTFLFGTSDPRPDTYLGVMGFGTDETFGPSTYAFVPISLILTLILPLAIGPFIRFRFPLWSWFAFTALVAVELAYYLR